MTIIQVVPATIVKEQVWKVRMNIWMMLTPKLRSVQGVPGIDGRLGM